MEEKINISKPQKILLQLGIPLFLFITIVITTFVFGTFYILNTTDREAKYSTEDVLQAVHSESLSFFENIQNNINIVENIINEGSLSSSYIFNEIIDSQSTILGFMLFDNKGEVLNSEIKSENSHISPNSFFSGTSYLKTISVKNNSYLFVQNDIVNQVVPIAHFVSIIPTKSGDIKYVLVSLVDLRHLRETVIELGKLTSSKIYILDNKFEVVVYSGGIIENDERKNFGELLRENINSYEFEDFAGNIINGSVISLTSTPWNILVETSTNKSFFGESQNIIIIILIIVIILAILMFLEIYLFSRKVLYPISTIEKSIKQVNSGDYKTRIHIKTKNEFSVLAGELNKIIESVEKNTSKEILKLKDIIEKQKQDTDILLKRDSEMEKTSEKIKQVDEAKSMFVSVAAHQMRTPLAAIKWAIKIVADGDVGPINPEQKNYLMKGYESNERLITLINDLLNVDKIESNKIIYKFVPVQIEDIIDAIIKELTQLSIDKGVKLQFEHGTEKLSKINADASKIRDALENLIDNAIKYTIGGGSVIVNTSIKDSDLIITIADTGIGIPESEYDKVFSKFFRAKNAIRSETDGSGLGLFIVREIIKKHGGDIVFESKENVGTKFIISIPLKK